MLTLYIINNQKPAATYNSGIEKMKNYIKKMDFVTKSGNIIKMTCDVDPYYGITSIIGKADYEAINEENFERVDHEKMMVAEHIEVYKLSDKLYVRKYQPTHLTSGMIAVIDKPV